jgi:hypothetical protein
MALLIEQAAGHHGRGSTIVTSQLPVDHWHELIVDPTIADATLDRLVHTAHRLTLGGETLRKPAEKSGKRSKLDTDNAKTLKATGELSAIIGMLSAMGLE